MVDITKVYYMTEAALFEKKHTDDVIKIVKYRRKDYILLHMLMVLLAATVGYALVIGAVLFLVIMSESELVLTVGQAVGIAAAVAVVYLVILITYYVISHKYYGEKHVRAREQVTEYLDILNDLKDYENAKKTLDEIDLDIG